MSVTPRLLTAADLERMPEGDGRRELIEGVLIELSPVGGEHGFVVAGIAFALRAFVAPRRLGRVLIETGFVLRREPDSVRAPDVSFVSLGRLGSAGLPRGFIDGAPDLAVEVASPDDSAEEIHAKVAEYLAAGTRLVWVLYPRSQTVLTVRAGGKARSLGAGETLDGDDVVPGFSIAVDDLWRD